MMNINCFKKFKFLVSFHMYVLNQIIVIDVREIVSICTSTHCLLLDYIFHYLFVYIDNDPLLSTLITAEVGWSNGSR